MDEPEAIGRRGKGKGLVNILHDLAEDRECWEEGGQSKREDIDVRADIVEYEGLNKWHDATMEQNEVAEEAQK